MSETPEIPGKPVPRAKVRAATDEIIPPATGHARQITRHISTNVYFRGGWIAATYRRVTTYTNPHDAPIFARMKPTNIGHTGSWSGHWDGEVVLQTFAQTETAAIAALLESLDELQQAYDPEAREILVAMACTTEATPWPLRPLGVRGSKPRRKRVKWTTASGKKIDIYKDTWRPHADPNCTCQLCSAFRKPTTTKRKRYPRKK